MSELALLATGLAVKFISLEIISRRYLANSYVEVGEVSKIYFYPVKSCGGIEIPSAKCTPCGLIYQGLHDRCFMICSSDGRFITQRHQPRMCLIKTSIPRVGEVVLTAPEMSDITVPLSSSENRKRKIVRIWGVNTEAEDCGDEISCWINTFLGLQGARMVVSREYMKKRICEPNIFTPNAYYKKTDIISFQDGSPLMITSEESVSDISSKVDNGITALNFRPNILARAKSGPFDEDNWAKIKIGSVKIHSMWLDERCKLTTVDTSAGVYRSDGEPLKTLCKYRKIRGHEMPILGVNIGVADAGNISIGDKITAILGEVA